jgi:hypothetical protein
MEQILYSDVKLSCYFINYFNALTSGSFAVGSAVSAEELMDRSVIALVLSPESTSTVKRFMIPDSTKFLTLRLTADSDKPISLPMSTNDFLESFFKNVQNFLV